MKNVYKTLSLRFYNGDEAEVYDEIWRIHSITKDSIKSIILRLIIAGLQKEERGE